MTRSILLTACLLTTLATACTTPQNDDVLLAGLAGAALGAITAEALLEDDDWVLVGALGGAAVGTLIARDRNRNRCAYARGDGTYLIKTC